MEVKGADIQIKRGDITRLKAHLSSDTWEDGEPFLFKDTNTISVKKGAGYVSFGEGLKSEFLPQTVKNSLLDMRHWDGSNYTENVAEIKEQIGQEYGAAIMFDELHDLDTHFYYVYRNNKLYRYPKMCYWQRNDRVFLRKNGKNKMFTFKELMDGKALNEGFHGTKVEIWEGHTGVLTQSDENKMPLYNAYLNRIEFDGVNDFMSMDNVVSTSNWSLEYKLNYIKDNGNYKVLFAHNSSACIFSNRFGKYAFRENYNGNTIYRIISNRLEMEHIKVLASQNGDFTTFKNVEILNSYNNVNTLFRFKSIFATTYGYQSTEGSISRLKFISEGEIILDLQI